jgi:murein DD-endopeptidase MepM/ murein hydrolase activator NlpD
LGNGFVIRHEDGSFAVYGQLSKVELGLERGAPVEQGRLLGEMGSSGYSRGVNLHFALTERRSSGFTKKRINPGKVFDPYVAVYTTEAAEITASSARLQGMFSYIGDAPEEVGILVGVSEDALGREPEYTDAELPDLPCLAMRYSVDRIGGGPLSPGTTYYWQCYAIVGGQKFVGEIKSFTTVAVNDRGL